MIGRKNENKWGRVKYVIKNFRKKVKQGIETIKNRAIRDNKKFKKKNKKNNYY